MLIEAKPDSAAAVKGQAYAVSLLSSRIFRGIGIWNKILPQIATFRHIRLSDADYPGVVKFQPADLGTEALGYVAEHQALLTPLQEFLHECSNVKYLCPVEVTKTQYQPDGVEIHLKVGSELQKIRTRLIVAADGARITHPRSCWNQNSWLAILAILYCCICQARKIAQMILLTNAFGLVVRLRFYLYQGTAAALSGQHPTQKQKH